MSQAYVDEEPVASAMFRSGSNRSYAKIMWCWQWNGYAVSILFCL